VVRLPGGITSTDHWFTVPLKRSADGTATGEETIRVFARELVLHRSKDSNAPYIIYL
jgi:hypothetical protein